MEKLVCGLLYNLANSNTDIYTNYNDYRTCIHYAIKNFTITQLYIVRSHNWHGREKSLRCLLHNYIHLKHM